jgi:plastocyanin
VRRAVAGLLGLGLLGGVALAISSGPIASTAAAAEGCAWHRHSKPVVKHVKRQGRLRRVRRVKRWWTCDAQPAVAAPGPVPPSSAAPMPPVTEAPSEEAPLARLSVKAVEWSYTLSRPEVDAGEVIVELNNQGEDSHNLKLQREGSAEPPAAVPVAEPAEQTSARLSLSPGSYRLYCSLDQHDEKGMHATLIVGGG